MRCFSLSLKLTEKLSLRHKFGPLWLWICLNICLTIPQIGLHAQINPLRLRVRLSLELKEELISLQANIDNLQLAIPCVLLRVSLAFSINNFDLEVILIFRNCYIIFFLDFKLLLFRRRKLLEELGFGDGFVLKVFQQYFEPFYLVVASLFQFFVYFYFFHIFGTSKN